MFRQEEKTIEPYEPSSVIILLRYSTVTVNASRRNIGMSKMSIPLFSSAIDLSAV